MAGALAIGAPAAWVGAWYPPFGVPAMAILGAALGASLGHVAGKRGWAPPQTGIAFHAVVLVCGLLVTVGPLVIAALADPSSGGVLTVAFIGGAVLALIVVTLSLAVGAVMAIAAAVAARV
ncbi:MAG: hypothetical protein KF729_36010 [Sandaracinaceae bacterium]|nr:hypothetical protein [Sandaracinaceae bacterium]